VTSCKPPQRLRALKCYSVCAIAKQVKALAAVMAVVTVVSMAAVVAPRPTAAVIVVVAVAKAHAAQLQTVVSVLIAHRVKTAVVSFSPHAPKAIARLTSQDRAAAVAREWDNLQALPANPVHHARLQANRIRCAPASI
jgi:hypothetical protein